MIGGVVFEKNDVMSYTLDSRILDLLEKLEYTYAMVNLEEISRLSSKYTLKLYLLAKRYEQVKSSGYKKLMFWRELFNLDVACEYKRLTREGFKPAVCELNEKTSMTVECVARGRPVSEVKLLINKITSGSDQVAQLLSNNSDQGSIENILIEEFGVDERIVQKLILDKGRRTAAMAVAELQQRKANGWSPDKSWAGYAVQTIKKFDGKISMPHPKAYKPFSEINNADQLPIEGKEEIKRKTEKNEKLTARFKRLEKKDQISLANKCLEELKAEGKSKILIANFKPESFDIDQQPMQKSLFLEWYERYLEQ